MQFRAIILSAVLALVASHVHASLVPGLDVRAWQGLDGSIDGSLFNLPGTANHSTFTGTLGYATEAIHAFCDNGAEYFFINPGSGVMTGPMPIGYVDRYTVEYRGKLKIDTAGAYRFATTSDDGSALWIDAGDVQTANPIYNAAAVKNNYYQGLTLRSSGAINLAAGYHDFVVRFYQGGGAKGLFVQWDPAGGSNFVDIPGASFYHEDVAGTVPLPAAAWMGLGLLGGVGLLRLRRPRER